MNAWIRFDAQLPTQGQFVAALTQHDEDEPVEDWERDLERNAVGIWIDGIIWEGNVPLRGFTHWLPLPDRPSALPASRQAELWYRTDRGTLEPERRRSPRS